MYKRGEADRYKNLKIEFVPSHIPELILTDPETGSAEEHIPLTKDGHCHLELKQLHTLVLSKGFEEKDKEQLRSEHAAQFADFRERVFAFYRERQPAKLEDDKFVTKLERILKEYAGSKLEEDDLMANLEAKYPKQVPAAEGEL